MKILLGVTGSISAYKALDICRGFTKLGHEVRVIVTKSACEFINPNAFHYLGAQKVYNSTDDFNLNQYEDSTNVLHVDLSQWCDRFVIAPLTANTMAKLSYGLCEDLLSSVFLANTTKPAILFPAMNTQMLENKITQQNLQRLSALKNVFIHPTKSGELACGDIGAGKLADVDKIIEIAPIINLNAPKKNILITTGATISPLDPVRYITNPSSGKTGYQLAKSYIDDGHQVTLIYGHGSTPLIQNLEFVPNIKLINANTTTLMQKEVQKFFDSCDVYISTAAMSDIEFKLEENKIKKSDFSNTLNFEKAPDVLASVLEKKKNQKVIGFAAETESSKEIFLEKWKRKPVDLLIGNIVNSGATSTQRGFNSESNEYLFIKDGVISSKKTLSKKDLSLEILKESLNESLND